MHDRAGEPVERAANPALSRQIEHLLDGMTEEQARSHDRSGFDRRIVHLMNERSDVGGSRA
jgi:hypothetical protein